MTLREVYNNSVLQLKAENIENCEYEARLILSFCLNRNNSYLLSHFEDSATDELYTKVAQLVARRIDGEPLQYILGQWEFYSLPFYVGPGVLIPRPETELICDIAIDLARLHNHTRIADFCSGSGCIAVAVASNCKNGFVDAVEKYEEAFEYLKKNIALNSTRNVTPICQDVFEYKPNTPYDLLLSNPPYVVSGYELSREVSCEPATALFGGADGLDFYRIISGRLNVFLKSGGDMVLEIGYDQAQSVPAVFQNQFKDFSVKTDISGNPRAAVGIHRI